MQGIAFSFKEKAEQGRQRRVLRYDYICNPPVVLNTNLSDQISCTLGQSLKIHGQMVCACDDHCQFTFDIQ